MRISIDPFLRLFYLGISVDVYLTTTSAWKVSRGQYCAVGDDHDAALCAQISRTLLRVEIAPGLVN